MRCKCNNIIPDGRLRLGYRTCVNCSTTQLYSYIPIIANKQVLEVQIVSQELSAAYHCKQTSTRSTNSKSRTKCSSAQILA